MIGNKLEQSIISVFQYNPSKTFSINTISKELKKAYPYINKKINYLIEEDILNKVTIGKSYQCFLNVDNEKARLLMAINEINTKDTFLEKNKELHALNQELTKIITKFSICAIILYEEKLLLITECTKRDIKSDIKKFDEIRNSSFILKKYAIDFFTKESFLDYYYKNVKLQKDHIILFGINDYLQMIKEIKDKLLINGFMGENK